ncbi:MAG: GTPase Era [Chitinophagales bacterium]|nr:GTPase Era [Chitinophagales bacterium]
MKQSNSYYTTVPSQHKAGYVNIVGYPNVGKSTLLNRLIGHRLSIITPKAQTTRHRILGFLNGENYQIVFSDTPGYVQKPAYKLHERMNAVIDEALQDADVLLWIIEPTLEEKDDNPIMKAAEKFGDKCIIALNKIDLISKESIENYRIRWKAQLPEASFIAISAEKNIGIDQLLSLILEKLPFSPPFFSKDEITDRPMRFFVSEIVREKIFLHFQQEIPYCTEVVVEEYKETPDTDFITCTIYVERESQKPILIGKAGSALTKIGKDARLHIEAITGKKAVLKLRVKVKEKWRSRSGALRQFGYF